MDELWLAHEFGVSQTLVKGALHASAFVQPALITLTSSLFCYALTIKLYYYNYCYDLLVHCKIVDEK